MPTEGRFKTRQRAESREAQKKGGCLQQGGLKGGSVPTKGGLKGGCGSGGGKAKRWCGSGGRSPHRQLGPVLALVRFVLELQAERIALPHHGLHRRIEGVLGRVLDGLRETGMSKIK